MQIKIVIGEWTSLAPDARAIRHEVFVVEQQVPEELELDQMDALCVHAVAYDDTGAALATARLLPDAHIGRMAVRKPARGCGLGGAILMRLMEVARLRGDTEVMLSAQTHAEAFYRRFGFVTDGAQFLDAGIPHVSMRHRFTT